MKNKNLIEISGNKLLRYLNFCSDFLSHVGKRREKKTNVIFQIDSVTIWETNKLQHTYCPISQGVQANRQ